MTKTNSDQEWPTFRGRRLTAKEMSSGLVITPLYRDEPPSYTPSFIPRSQVWMGRNGRVFLELRFGQPPFETNGRTSTLTGERFHELRPEAESIYEEARKLPDNPSTVRGNTPPGLKSITWRKVRTNSLTPGDVHGRS